MRAPSKPPARRCSCSRWCDVARGADALAIPIGAGAGDRCDGKVLVLHDMLGIYPGRRSRFVRNFAVADDGSPRDAEAYVAAVKDGTYPAEAQRYD